MKDFITPASDMLATWEEWFSGGKADLKEDANKLLVAASFAAQAFDMAADSGVTRDGAPIALMRAFLLALVDPLHPGLDHLRADPTTGPAERARQ